MERRLEGINPQGKEGPKRNLRALLTQILTFLRKCFGKERKGFKNQREA